MVSAMWFEALRHDVKLGARLIVRAPGFSATAILTLALGIGASTAIFSQINALLWKPLPVARPAELRLLLWSSRKPSFLGGPNAIAGPDLPSGPTFGSFSYIAYRSLRDNATAFSDLACWTDLGETRPVVMRDVGFGSVQFVSGNYFHMLDVQPERGRLLTPDDDAIGTTAAVVSHSFWQRQFGGAADVTGRTIDLNGKAFAIVGVTRPGFFGIDPSSTPDVMVPTNAIQLAAATANPLANPFLWQACRIVGRLRPGVPDEQARQEAERWLNEAIRAHPPGADYEPPRVWLADASQGLPTLRDAIAAPLVILMGVVAAILLIACANISGLLTVRGAARRREIATRFALGASRGRIVRQLITESLLLSLCGGGAGLALAYALARLSPAFMSRFMPTLYGVSRQLSIGVDPDARVLLFAVAATIGTGVVFGSLPAMRATSISLIGAIRQYMPLRGTLSFLAGDKAMVALQSALSLMLIVGAGLLVQTIAHLRAAALGYRPEGVLYAKIEPRTGGIPPDRRGDFFERAVRRVAEVPGVVSASATDSPPLGARSAIFLGSSYEICTPGFVPPEPRDAQAALAAVAPRYFETMGIPVMAGREFEWRDRPTATTNVAIVNETFARRFFGGANPPRGAGAPGVGIDRRFGLNCPSNPAAIAVVGVVADAKEDGPRQPSAPKVYLPLGDNGNVLTLVLRTAGRPELMIPTVRKTIAELSATIPTFGEVTPVALREQQMRQERLLTMLLAAFGAVALALSAMGIHGMLGYSVLRRTPEIGVRMALGATPSAVVGLVVKESMVPVLWGLAAGALGAVAAARAIQSFLFEVSSADAATIAAGAAILLSVAMTASIVPARRAAQVDPLRALRTE